MKTYVLYHGNCPDGTGAALAAWMALGEADGHEPIHYIPVNYGQPMPQIDDGSRVLIVDFSYKRDELDALHGRSHELVVLDHHQTAEADLKDAPYAKFDMNKSGAVMAWEYFNPTGTVPPFFLYLQDRDLWKFELPMSREVSMALRSYPMDFREWRNLQDVEILKLEGIACRRLTEQLVDNMAKHHRWAVFVPAAENGDPSSEMEAKVILCDQQAGHLDEHCYSVPVANATVFFSEVGEKLLEMYPEAPFAAYYLDRKDGKRQWGMRSRPDFDCSVIAKAFGGGGHKCASGFTTC